MGEETGKDKTLRVDQDLTAINAVGLREQFVRLLPGDGPLLVDLSKVSEMDTAGFQLLAALRREAAEAGRRFSIVAHSPATHAVLKLYNMEEYFGFDADALGILGDAGDDEEMHSRTESAE